MMVSLSVENHFHGIIHELTLFGSQLTVMCQNSDMHV